MIDLNFITPEYKLKLLMRKLLQFTVLIVFLILGVELGVSQYLKSQVKAIKSEMKTVNGKISKFKKVNKDLDDKTKLIPDLTSKIQGFGDLLQEKGSSFSDVLYILSKYTPKKVWYKKLTYKDNQIIMNGVAAKDSNNSAELNVLNLERTLKDSGSFSKVHADYVTTAVEKGNEVKSFQYSLILSRIIKSETEGDDKK